jgi:hypothetical protein
VAYGRVLSEGAYRKVMENFYYGLLRGETIMGKVESTIKSEILRLAKKEVKAAFSPLRREVWTMRINLSGLSKGFAALNRQAKELRLGEARPKLEASPEEVKASRLTFEKCEADLFLEQAKDVLEAIG